MDVGKGDPLIWLWAVLAAVLNIPILFVASIARFKLREDAKVDAAIVITNRPAIWKKDNSFLNFT